MLSMVNESAINQAKTTEEMRQQGFRPEKPSYHSTPLASVGKTVRASIAPNRCRRALIECVNDDGTVDAVFIPGPLCKEEKDEDATLSIESLRPLENFELMLKDEWQGAVEEDIQKAVSIAKECGNTLFKLGDLQAACDIYGRAIAALSEFQISSQNACLADCSTSLVLVNRDGALLPGRITATDCNRKQVDVLIELKTGKTEAIRGVPVRALIYIHFQQLPLQASLHLNRARTLMQEGQQQEAAQDLTVVIALWSAYGLVTKTRKGLVNFDSDHKDQLTKAFYLRAKTKIARFRLEPARSDIQDAWQLEPNEATSSLLRQLERELELAQREKVRSNKRLAKEIAKLADSAFSGLSEIQLAGFGSIREDSTDQ